VDLFYDVIFLDPVTTGHVPQLQVLSPHRRTGVHVSRSGGQPSAKIWGTGLTKPGTE
jgi:hypothetical protein